MASYTDAELQNEMDRIGSQWAKMRYTPRHYGAKLKSEAKRNLEKKAKSKFANKKAGNKSSKS